jgi:hypothetical protein
VASGVPAIKFSRVSFTQKFQDLYAQINSKDKPRVRAIIEELVSRPISDLVWVSRAYDPQGKELFLAATDDFAITFRAEELYENGVVHVAVFRHIATIPDE